MFNFFSIIIITNVYFEQSIRKLTVTIGMILWVILPFSGKGANSKGADA